MKTTETETPAEPSPLVPAVGLPTERKKLLTKMFKGLDCFVGTDKTRAQLTHAFIPNRASAEATDGHCAVRFINYSDNGHGLEPGYYLPRQALAQLAADQMPTPIKRPDAWTWPTLDMVVPSVPYPADESLIEHTLLGAKLVGRIMDGIALLLSPWNSDPAVKVWTPTDEHSPVRYDAGESQVAAVTAVLMPRRRD
jgi:hypothetical protein